MSYVVVNPFNGDIYHKGSLEEYIKKHTEYTYGYIAKESVATSICESMDRNWLKIH